MKYFAMLYSYRPEKFILRIYSTTDDVFASNVGEKSHILKWTTL